VGGKLQVALVKLGLRNEGLIVPGYTHLQRAQPLLLQHVLLAFVEQVEPWNAWEPMFMALLCT
jgi:argininosuccinate lyase